MPYINIGFKPIAFYCNQHQIIFNETIKLQLNCTTIHNY